MNTDLHPSCTSTVADAPPSSRPRRRTGRNSGASLVEVLIVLSIILIAVFTVIQIFPIGFTSLKRSESRLRADRLARNATETLVADDSALPESISFSFYNNAGILQTVTDADPDDLGTYQNDPGNKLYFSNVNKFRYIKNEPIRVPLATAVGGVGFGGGVGSVHFLTFGPVFMNSTVGDPAGVPTSATQTLFDSYLKVTSEKLVGVVVDSTEPGTSTARRDATDFAGYLRGANTYVIDYGDTGSAPAVLFARANKDRVFTVTYSFENESVDPAIVETVNVTIPVPANSLAWINLGTLPLVPGSETVVRDFTRLRADDPATGTNENDAWDPTDPYQYKLASANVSPATSANLGVVAFNPAGANFSVSVPGGIKPFTALASYAVLDWHILRDDREVPAGGKVRTSLPNIRVRGDEFVDFNATGANRTQVYPGLYPQTAIYNSVGSIPTEAVSPDIQVFNLSDDTGTARLLVAGNLANKATTDANADYWINRGGRGGTYPAGIIYINTARVPAGSKVRILYKAQGDWAVAFQKAAKSYKQQEAAQRPVPNRSEVFAVDYGGTPTNYLDDTLYFHRTEINKSVTATVEIETASGVTRLPSRQFAIQNADGAYAYATATDVIPELRSATFNGNSILGWRVFGDIKGASLKTRVIWQDEQNGRNPYKIADLETFVTRQAQ